MSSQQIGVCILVFDKTIKKVLLGKRKNSYKAGMYGIPGGKLELKESVLNCGKRELAEETGLQANSLKYLGVIPELQEVNNFIHFAFVCTDYSGKPKLMEPEKCESWDWYSLNKLPEYVLPGHKAAINLYKNPDSINLIDLC